MSFSTTVAGLKLEHPIMNAAGTVKRWEGPEGVETLLRSASAAVVLGSITLKPRDGNSGEVYFPDPRGGFSLNSLGLPNPGSQYLTADLSGMVNAAHEVRKPFCVSVAGFSPEEYAELSAIASIGGADLIELNLGCPNVWAGRDQKAIPAFEPELIADIVHAVESRGLVYDRFAVKLSPYSDPMLLREVAAALAESSLIQVVTTCNTFPNGFAFKDGKQAISNLDGFAGVGGPALKPIGLGQVRQFRAWLPDRIDLIGVGGIQTGQDVLDYLRAGAKAVQVATALINRGPQVFSELLSEYAEIAS